MAEHLVIVENHNDWPWADSGLKVITSAEYLANPERYRARRTRIINLCRSYRYLSEGYYCSLLAEARRHTIVPSVRTLTDLSRKAIYSLNFDDFEKSLRRLPPVTAPNPPELANLPEHAEQADRGGGHELRLLVCFGHTQEAALSDLARQVFEAFPCPILRIEFQYKAGWRIARIKSLTLNNLLPDERTLFANALERYLSRRWRSPKRKAGARYDMAILRKPNEMLPPSNASALRKFIEAGRRLGMDVDLIEARDYNRLGEYDALFIRETTSVAHYTYRFAKKAEAEGLVVMDDPESIVKCTNKVYLTELLRGNRVPLPAGAILRKGEGLAKAAELGYPMVLKIPDGSFSRGIYKAETPGQAHEYSRVLFRDSDLILAQEFLYTEFDWRIGVLNRRAIFACQYFMSKAHWQIVKHGGNGRPLEGGYRAWSLPDVPPEVVDTAVKAANLIGDGFYGVDLKQTNKGVVVIEVNDNPNVDTGVEDGVVGNDLYETIMSEFLRRLELRTANVQAG